jgi:DNA-binding MarR family transcriptional regulator
MNKREAKRLIGLRGYGRKKDGKYTRSQCRVLEALVDGTPANGYKWQDFDITTGTCATTQKELARKTLLTERTVIDAIKAFEAAGLITVHRGQGAHGQNTYTAHLEPLKEAQTSPQMRTILVGSKPPKKDRKEYFRKRYREMKEAVKAAGFSGKEPRVAVEHAERKPG